MLAEADEYDLVRQVQEFYCDYYAYSSFLFSANISFSKSIYQPPTYWLQKEKNIFERNLQTVISSFLALKTAPIIRYSKSSDLAKGLANAIHKRMADDAELFYFEKEKKEPPLLLIVDRRDDPVTPLLMQWTYQAMVHELLEIKNNRVDLRKAKSKADMPEVTLSSYDDSFFKRCMYLNYGDLGLEVKGLVENFAQQKKGTSTKLETIEDMQRFVEHYPELKAVGNLVSKHVALVTELHRICEDRHLMNVSELEQSLACDDDHTTALDNLLTTVENSRIFFYDKLRLVLLYALRYENQKDSILQFRKLLLDRATNDHERFLVQALDTILVHAGQSVRGGDLYGNKTLTGKIGSALTGLKGVENIYIRFRPKLASQIEAVLKGKLDLVSYPFVEGGTKGGKYKKIFVYVVGGVTYAEAAAVHSINQSEPGLKIILGGSYIHNSASFINDVLGLESPLPMPTSLSFSNRKKEQKEK